MIVDVNMGWALDVGNRLGINGAFFWPASAAMFALLYNTPKLIEDGIIDCNGMKITFGNQICFLLCIWALLEPSPKILPEF